MLLTLAQIVRRRRCAQISYIALLLSTDTQSEQSFKSWIVDAYSRLTVSDHQWHRIAFDY